jgi:uncharacterized protein (UPF0332 family)
MVQSWYDLASEARKVANRLVSEHYRACLNRAYYAAFSKVSFKLASTPGVVFPQGREGPNHPGKTGAGGIRRQIEAHFKELDTDKRIKLSELIGRLYTLRIAADYKPSVNVDGRDAREAVSIINTVFESF